jgi:hypothetical protein
MIHEFTPQIVAILEKHFGSKAGEVLEQSPLLSYINIKTKSASRGSKSRGAYANLYAIYVLIEDYLSKGYDSAGKYSNYEGAVFSDLFARQRELPFGSKLQNHALNSRLNEEFKKYFPVVDKPVVIRDLDTSRYWINENLLSVAVSRKIYKIGQPIIEIINAYVDAKQESFNLFIQQCEELLGLENEKNDAKIFEFVSDLLNPNVDARLFEIVSYGILKSKYKNVFVWIGYTKDSTEKKSLILYKTGRTNANDGGIDFVMRPLGRFFQVTETMDLHKYFLDIEKVQRYPITFVIKSELPSGQIKALIHEGATAKFGVKVVVDRYMESIEEVINLVDLRVNLQEVIDAGEAELLLKEIIFHSRLEFNQLEDNDSIDSD